MQAADPTIEGGSNAGSGEFQFRSGPRLPYRILGSFDAKGTFAADN